MRDLPPLLLHYYVTERCNCRCTFCHIWKIPAEKSDDASIAHVRKNLRDARQLGVRFVDFTGGEPLLHEKLPEMLFEAKRFGLRTSVTTNCLIYVQRSAELKGLIDFLHFSLDSLRAERHDASRGQPVFAQVMHSLDKARQLGERPDLLFTISRDNSDDLKPMADFAQTLGIMLVLNPLFSLSSPTHNADLTRTMEQFSATPFVYVNKAFHLLRRAGGNQKCAPRCRAVDSVIVISPDNKILLPCYHFARQKLDLADRPGRQTAQSSCKDGSGHTAGVLPTCSGNNIKAARQSSIWQFYRENQGRFTFCQGCHLNCYFDPSFMVKIDYYFWQSLL
ncbi:radical SAM protein, partial [candidate division KSB1 bacterium]